MGPVDLRGTGVGVELRLTHDAELFVVLTYADGYCCRLETEVDFRADGHGASLIAASALHARTRFQCAFRPGNASVAANATVSTHRLKVRKKAP